MQPRVPQPVAAAFRHLAAPARLAAGLAVAAAGMVNGAPPDWDMAAAQQTVTLLEHGPAYLRARLATARSGASLGG